MLQKRTLQAFLFISIVFSLVACGSGASTTSPAGGSTRTAVSTLTPEATATRLAAGTVLYQANLSQGLVGWQGTQGWRVVGGQLETVASAATLAFPYRPVVGDYAIELHMQIVRALTDNGGYFSIFAKPQAGKNGYQTGVSGLKKPGPFGSHPQAQATIDPSGDQSPGGYPIDYEPGFGWHTYRVEVRGSEVRLLDGGVQIGDANSSQTDTLSNGPLGLDSEAIVLRVSSLRITAL